MRKEIQHLVNEVHRVKDAARDTVVFESGEDFIIRDDEGLT